MNDETIDDIIYCMIDKKMSPNTVCKTVASLELTRDLANKLMKALGDSGFDNLGHLSSAQISHIVIELIEEFGTRFFRDMASPCSNGS